jgi:3-hydroxyisobutyrate dehydrogenase-like beta-hydroxyacid dehydrogenase
MGLRIARRLLDAGHELVVWNRTGVRAEPLAARGAVAAGSPAEAASLAEAVITMVTNPAALREVTEGPTGVAAGAGDGTTVLQMPTVGPSSIERLSPVLRPETHLLDAPVLGIRSEAETGTLKIFAGGPPELVERWTPLLSELGSVLHMGPVGAGTSAKLVANTTLVGVIGVLGEALALADGLGLSREAAFEVLAATPLGAQAERRLEAAAAAGVDLRLTEAARTWVAEAEDAGHGDDDYSAVLARITDANDEGGRAGRLRSDEGREPG